MKIQIAKLLILCVVLFSHENIAQTTLIEKSVENIATSDDLKIILGKWTGNLTYIDYRTNNPYSMPSNVEVKQGNNEKQLLLHITYPKEPKANSKEKIRISSNGQQLNKKAIVSRSMLPQGDIQIITEYSGKDNNEDALIKNIYILGTNQFVIRKEVKFQNSDSWMMRNEYNFNR